MGDCGCKKNKIAEDVVMVYIIPGNTDTAIISKALVDRVRYTPKQASVLLESSGNKDKVLVYEGPLSRATGVVQSLSKYGIKCNAVSKRLVK